MAIDGIRDVARTEVVTTRADTLAHEAADIMREEGVGSVVIEENQRPIGIVTDRDLAVRVLADGNDGSETRVREIMTGTPATVTDDEPVFDVAEEMHENEVRRMPVVDGGGRLVGIVTLDDIYQRLVREQGHLAGVVTAESPGRPSSP